MPRAQDQGSGEDPLDSNPGSIVPSCVTPGKYLTSLILSAIIHKMGIRSEPFCVN